MSNSTVHDPYLALRFGGYRLLLTGNLIARLGSQMLTLAIGWELYERTDSALALGLVGLVQLLPVLLLVFVVGHVADRYDRKAVVVGSRAVLIVSSLGLAGLSLSRGPLAGVYGCLFLQGIGGAFGQPAGTAFLGEVVPEEAFENSVSWTTGTGQAASIVGPALGGLVISVFHGAALVYVLNALAGAVSVGLVLLVQRHRGPRHRPTEEADEEPTLRSLGEGIAFLRRTPVILWAITLDLFAVLFGGATTLLPIFARDILQVGPTGLGWLQAAPSIGAFAIAFYLAHRPPLRRAGPVFLLAVAGFGLATIVFGVSRSFWLSLSMLAALGGLDSVSMVVRDTLMLTRVPHAMRGRVAAIEGVFVGSSNQLGGFESGLTAQLFGPILSVVAGGIGTILVVLAIAVYRPELRQLTTLREDSTVEPELLVRG
jgi:MFS family permease